jgi:hypothetical protein
MAAQDYPVSLAVEPLLTDRNRLTTALRLILALPHLILVGGFGTALFMSDKEHGGGAASGGLLGVVAAICAIVGWFAIIFTGQHIPALQGFTAYYLRWRARVIAYAMLLEDQYPPFGDGDYPASLTITEPQGNRNRLAVAFRLPLALPHILALFFVTVGAGFATVIAWFAILLTGNHPAALYDFVVGATRWRLRVEAYLFLMIDEYPPFSLH